MKRRVRISNVVAGLLLFFAGSCFAECDCPQAYYFPLYDDPPADTTVETPAVRWVR